MSVARRCFPDQHSLKRLSTLENSMIIIRVDQAMPVVGQPLSDVDI